MLSNNFEVPFGEGHDHLMLTEEEARSHVARIAYRQGFEDATRQEQEKIQSLLIQTELSVRAQSTRFLADVFGIFVSVPAGLVFWALAGEVAGVVAFGVTMTTSALLLWRSFRLRKDAESTQ